MFEIQIQKQLSYFQLDIEFRTKNEIVVLFGHSGSGKTTILNIIAGLIQPDSGWIKLNDQLFFSNMSKPVSTQKRNIGYLFQDYALFPHMTVERNIIYGMKQKEKGVKTPLLAKILEVLGINHLLHKYPHQISGGEKQRVALARALATNPSMLLLDEPLTSLDKDTRAQCQDELLRLHQMWHIPFIIVTHDAEEAKKLGEKILYIEKGKIHKSSDQYEANIGS